MKKYLKIVVLFVLMINFIGCKNINISNEVFENCELAINIIDDYLNNYINSEKAYKMLDSINCNYKEEYEDDFNVCLKISGIRVDFFLHDDPYSTKVVTSNDFKKSRDELAKLCGIKK